VDGVGHLVPQRRDVAQASHAARCRRLVYLYEDIAAQSRTMRHSALAGDWDDVAALRRDCIRLMTRIRELAPRCRLDAQQARRRLEMLREILADDAEIRALHEPRLRWVDQLLHASSSPQVSSDPE